MNFKEWWHMAPRDAQDEARPKWVGRFFLITLIGAMIIWQASMSVAIMEHGARLDVLEEPPEIIHPDIAIDMAVPRTPYIFIKHKSSLKNQTKGVFYDCN